MSEIIIKKLSKNELVSEINNFEEHEFFELIGKLFLADINIGKRILIQMIKESNYK